MKTNHILQKNIEPLYRQAWLLYHHTVLFSDYFKSNEITYFKFIKILKLHLFMEFYILVGHV